MGASSESNPLPTPTARARPLGCRHRRNAGSAAYLNWGLREVMGGEWLRRSEFEPFVPRTPGLIWVLGPWAGDVMVDGSFRGGRPRPLGLWWIAAGGRESRQLRELAGRLAAIEGVVGLAERVGGLG